MATVDPVKRERAESAYHALFSRVIETPGLDLYQEFNFGPTPPSVNDLLAAGGFTARQRGQLMNFLGEANRAGLDTQRGELRKAEFRWNSVEEGLGELKAAQLLSPGRLRSFEQTVNVMEGVVEGKRPERLADAQRGFAEALSAGFKSDEQSKADAEKVRLALLDAGIDNDRASDVYHGLQDGLKALRYLQIASREDGARTAKVELDRSVDVLARLGPPVIAADNVDSLRRIQIRLDSALSFDPGVLRDDGTSDVIRRTNQDYDPEKAAADAPTRLAQMEQVNAWYEGKQKTHSLGGFYDWVFKEMPGAIQDVKRYMDPDNPDPNRDLLLAEAVQRSEKVLGTLDGNFRNKSPEQLAKYVDDMREGMFKRADMVADAFGELPVVGPIGRGIIKETSIALRYASGDISAKEAVSAGFKEAASSTVDVLLGSGKFKYANKGVEFGGAFATTFSTEAVAEIGKAWAMADKDPGLDRGALMRQAVKTAAIKGLMDAGGKFLVNQGEFDSNLGQGMKDLILSVAKKFGVDRELDAELSRRSERGAVLNPGPMELTAPNDGSRLLQGKVAALNLGGVDTADKVEKVSNRLEINGARDGLGQLAYVFAGNDARTVFATTQDPRTSALPVERTSANVAEALNEDMTASRNELARVRQAAETTQSELAQTQTQTAARTLS